MPLTELDSLQEQRGELITKAQQLNDNVQAEKRDMTAEEANSFDAMMNAADELHQKAEALKKKEARQRFLLENSVGQSDKKEVAKTPDEERKREAFRHFLVTGDATEYRAYQADSATEGGVLIPDAMLNQLIRKLDDLLFIRQLATTYTVGRGSNLGVPTVIAGASDADWTTELGTGNEETTIRLGKRKFAPHPLAKRLKISRTLLAAPGINAEGVLQREILYALAKTQEKAYLTGSGVGQPLGLFTASVDGISTGRDMATGNSGTAITFDGLIENQYNLKEQYRANAQWLFHRDALKMIVKLKDSQNQPLFLPSYRDGQPDTLLGDPFRISEYVPNTFTSGLYVGLYGDFSHYWIVDALGMELQQLRELYAENNQVGYIIRHEGDGMPVLEEAFSRVKLG